MSKLIIDRLKQIEESAEQGADHFSVSLTDSSTFDRQSSLVKSNEQMTSAHGSLSTISKKDSEIQEEYHTAKVWAGKLKHLTRDQRLFAEKAIYDVLFEAELGNLQKSSVKINASSFTENICRSSVKSKSLNNSTTPSTSQIDHCHSDTNVPMPTECAHRHLSSEVIISESFPIEISGVPSSPAKMDDISFLKPYTKPTKPNDFIVAASPVSIKKSPSASPESCQSTPSKNVSQEIISEDYSLNVATNTSECIISRLGRYIRRVYDHFNSI